MSQRALHRSRGARARRGCQLLAARALGLAAAADAQLAEPTARVSLRRRGPGRLHDDARGDRLHLALCRVVACAGAHAHHRHLACSEPTPDTTSRRPTAIFAAAPSCSRAAPATFRACRRSARRCRRRSRASRRSTTAIRTTCRKAACWSSAHRPRACSSPTKSIRSGRPVTLSVGEHVRLPRTYRGRDVLWWMDASGVWNQRYDEIDDLTRARRLPSPQLVGTPERTTLDLNALSSAGVEIVGRLAAVRDGQALFSGGLRNQFALADLEDEPVARHVRRVGAEPRAARPRSVLRNGLNRHARRSRRG